VIVVADTAGLLEIIDGVQRPLCLVPTMGALHEGHLALIREARKRVGVQGTVAVSIFVNPIQFDRKEDLEKYPRPLESDLAACEQAGADLVFTPDAAQMYATDHSIVISENRLSQFLCGASRPGHFSGVCTVVMKLFLLFRAQSAVFGKKDFQQLAIIRRMVRDLNVPIEIIGHTTIRESDGVAMSSRNVRLSSEQRADAPILHRSLCAARDLLQLGERQAEPILAAARHHLSKSGLLKIDYLALVDAETLEPVAMIRRPAILAVACFYDNVRLIDHVELMP
jgi:pantoate--beta-alanine ligase